MGNKRSAWRSRAATVALAATAISLASLASADTVPADTIPADTMPAEPDMTLLTGAKPLPPEEYTALPKVARFRAWLPPAVDLSDQYPVPGNQYPQPNCAAWATTYAARSYLLGRELGRRPLTNEAFSPAYAYNRLRPPGSACTGAVAIRSALDLLRDEGAVTLSDFPDDANACNVPAPATLKVRAQSSRVPGWRAIDRERPSDNWHNPLILDDVKGAIARHVPVVFGMPVGEVKSFYSGVHGSETYATSVRTNQNFHAMAAVGYDDGRQALRVMNSWGPAWADHGYFWLSYDTFRLLATEAYALEAPVKAPPGRGDADPKQAFATELSNFQCGAVQAHDVNGHLVVDGFGGLGPSMARLKALTLAVSPRAEFRVAYHAWPQCEAETTLSRPLQIGAPGLAVITPHGSAVSGDPVAMRAGTKFGIRAEATAARPYLSLVYLQDDGSAVELYRGLPRPGADGRRVIEVGTGGLDTTRFEVGPPYGDEIVIALASAQPLFGTELATYATERQFLSGLRSHLRAASPDSVAASVVRLKTSE